MIPDGATALWGRILQHFIVLKTEPSSFANASEGKGK